MSYPNPEQQPQGNQELPGTGVPGYPESGGGEAVHPHQHQAPVNPEHPQQPVPQPYQDAQSQGHQVPQPPVYSQQPVQAGQAAYSTPFSQVEMAMPSAASSGNKAALWATLGGLGVLVALVVGYFIYQSLQDPFRTLDTFPTEKYLSNHESVVGSRFRAKLTVVAELGGTFDQGRLLSFRDETSQRSLAVLVSPDLGQVGFSKGQSYLAEIEVKNGGLIYAHAFKKN